MLACIRWLIDPLGFLHRDLNLVYNVFQTVVLGQADPNQRHKVSKTVIGLADGPSNQLQQQVNNHGNEDLRLAGILIRS